jgi:hypothetical protein
MGNCASNTEDKARLVSDMIDLQIEEDSKQYKRECKILLLGAYPALFDSYPTHPTINEEDYFIDWEETPLITEWLQCLSLPRHGPSIMTVAFYRSVSSGVYARMYVNPFFS